jgi:hypothetical protein
VAAHYGQAIDLQDTGHVNLGRLFRAGSAHDSPQLEMPGLAALDRAFPAGLYPIPYGNISK